MSEPWLDRKKLAGHFSCSIRSIELALADGMPHAIVFGRVKFQVSKVDPWLRERGYLRETDGPSTVAAPSSGPGDACDAPGPDREVSPDGI